MYDNLTLNEVIRNLLDGNFMASALRLIAVGKDYDLLYIAKFDTYQSSGSVQRGEMDIINELTALDLGLQNTDKHPHLVSRVFSRAVGAIAVVARDAGDDIVEKLADELDIVAADEEEETEVQTNEGDDDEA